MLEANGRFYVVFSYHYDGYNGWNDPVFPASEWTFAMDYLRKQQEEDDDFQWNTETSLRKDLPYGYTELYIQEMTMNEEV